MEKIPNNNENNINEGNEESNKEKDSYTAQEELEFLEHHIETHLEQFPAVPENRDPSLEIARVETLLSEFESKHSLENLNNVVDISENLSKVFLHKYHMAKEGLAYAVFNLSDEDREKFNIRNDAQEDLKEINSLINTLRQETNIPEEEFNKIYNSYRVLSKAVGYLSKNTQNLIVHH